LFLSRAQQTQKKEFVLLGNTHGINNNNTNNNNWHSKSDTPQKKGENAKCVKFIFEISNENDRRSKMEKGNVSEKKKGK
jgi:hypothetical protein